MRLATGCRPLDDLLGGGLEPGAITLVYGEAGTGKTNLCLQAAVQADAADGRRIGYIDTEGVSLERLEQIAGDRNQDLLKSILFFTPHNLVEQQKMVAALAKIKDPKLIIVDSINMHYRLLLGQDGETATKSITAQMSSLLALARTTDVPILITGQVFGDEDAVRPFGGRIMEHIVKTMIRLERIGTGQRKATIHKHRSQPEGAYATFRITATGLE
jgi:DNA repair protein RadB